MNTNETEGDNLGFRFRKSKSGDVTVTRNDKTVATLRASDAADFLGEAEGADSFSQQQLMARVTGNYKRGNEKLASLHPRNRKSAI
jgi:c-di-AMP phosphodiesterase-like protein